VTGKKTPLLLLLASVATAGVEAVQGRVTILHTNDLHTHVDDMESAGAGN